MVETTITFTLTDGEHQYPMDLLSSYCQLIKDTLEEGEQQIDLTQEKTGTKIYATKENFDVLQKYCAVANQIGKPNIHRPIHKFISTIQ